MDGIARARALRSTAARVAGRPRSARASQFDIDVATAADDGEIRRLLRESAFAGRVSLSLEREPDSRLAAAIEGDAHEQLVARERRSGRVAGIAGRAFRDVFVNGAPSRVAYLGQLRIDARFRRSRGLLDAGFEFCRQSHGGLLHLASIVADNEPARRLLSRAVDGWPRFDAIDTLVTLAIPVRHVRQRPGGIDLQPASPEWRAEILGCLARNGRRYQFYPQWKDEHFDSPRLRGLSLSDFTVAVSGGRAIGCLAVWDQRAFKQAIVRGYAGRLARWRPVVNLLSPWLRTPRLPAVGLPLEFAYLSHVAVDEDDDNVLVALVRDACVRASARGLEYIALGLPARSPVLSAVERSFAHRRYESLLYAVTWPDVEAVAASLDGRPANPEIALL
ncbi:MAG TPA: hypothetical protein VFJ02_17815 [Vicinamibacterales bacterium]|nr:hypothetical protein [Vicinamibacterales bacterium]